MKKITSIILAGILIFSLCLSAQARLVGDVDGNKSVTANDALLILLYTVGKSTEINTVNADVNADGKINSSDALDVLKICVGTYSGSLETDDNLVTSYKADIIDSIVKTGKYTMVTTVENNGSEIPVVIEYNNGDIAATMSSELTMRILIIKGTTYVVFPKTKIYSQSTATVDLPSISTNKYIKSEYKTINSKQCVCETYMNDDGDITRYYFQDGKWIMMETVVDVTTTTKNISDFFAGVDDSSFSLSGYTKISLSL